MKFIFALLFVALLSTPCSAGDIPTPKVKPNYEEHFNELERFIPETAKPPLPSADTSQTQEELQEINIDHERASSQPFEAFENSKGFVNGGFISVMKYKETTRGKLENAYDALMIGDHNEAIKIYQGILKSEPDNRLALFGIATAYHQNKQKEKAATAYQKVLTAYPDYKEALNNYVVLLAEENPQRAIAKLKTIERRYPLFAPLPAQIGVMSYKQHRYRDAAVYFNKALQIEPENVVYQYNLAVAYDKMGNVPAARQLYHQLLDTQGKGERIPLSEKELRARIALLD